jgi:hypothetical protein
MTWGGRVVQATREVRDARRSQRLAGGAPPFVSQNRPSVSQDRRKVGAERDGFAAGLSPALPKAFSVSGPYGPG